MILTQYLEHIKSLTLLYPNAEIYTYNPEDSNAFNPLHISDRNDIILIEKSKWGGYTEVYNVKESPGMKIKENQKLIFCVN